MGLAFESNARLASGRWKTKKRMNPRRLGSEKRLNRRALTLVELLAVVAVALVVGCLLLPAAPRRRVKASRVQCMNNLKQIGLAFHLFASDHNGQYPMALSVTNGGTREWLDDPSKVWVHYLALSNTFLGPNPLVCPTDRLGRHKATLFATNRAATTGARPMDGDPVILFSANQNTSYFVALGAATAKPAMLLAGDRHVTNLEPVRFEYGMARVGNLGTNHVTRAGAAGAGWDRRMHDGGGNVGRVDGSAAHHNSSSFRRTLRDSDDPDNRIAVPD